MEEKLTSLGGMQNVSENDMTGLQRLLLQPLMAPKTTVSKRRIKNQTAATCAISNTRKDLPS